MAAPPQSLRRLEPLARSAAHFNPTPLLPGVALCALLAGVAMQAGQWPWLAAHGFSALTVAIVLGIIMGNSIYGPLQASCAMGVGFSRQKLLRLGVMLYGLRLTLGDVAHVGLQGIGIDTIMVTSTFAIAVFVGTRWLGIERRQAMLIGAGSAICGAAAVLATEPVVRGKSSEVTVAVATVVVFGTLAIFAYPALYFAIAHTGILEISPGTFGLYIGSSVHEVAQVVAAARFISDDAAANAVIAKMVRVMMLAPFLIALSSRESRADSGEGRAPITIPWFAVGFMAVVVAHSFIVLEPSTAQRLSDLDTLFLAMAMAGLGLGTQWTAIRAAGTRPLALALILFAWLMVGGALVNGTIDSLVESLSR